MYTALSTLYQEQERRKRVLGWRRTQKALFEGEWEQITSWLMANPERSSGDIFRELQRLSPGRYQPLQIHTLQRGMRKIRGHPARTPLRSNGKKKLSVAYHPRQSRQQRRQPEFPVYQLNKPPGKMFGGAMQGYSLILFHNTFNFCLTFL